MVNVVVQAGSGPSDKYLYDEKTLEHKETRQVSEPYYPYPYGFIPGTTGADGDCVDCYVITDEELRPGIIIECEVVGLLAQTENNEIDHKVLAAMPGKHVDLNQELLKELQDFIYAVFSRFPEIQVHVGPILPREAALRYIQEAQDYPQ